MLVNLEVQSFPPIPIVKVMGDPKHEMLACDVAKLLLSNATDLER